MSKVEGVQSVVVDTTARAVFRTDAKFKLTEKSLNEALDSIPGMKARKLSRTKWKEPAAEFNLLMDGFS